MSIRKNIFILSVVYILIVVLFAFIYYLYWQENPDNFIVQDEINLFPITELRQLLQSDDLNIPMDSPSELEFSLSKISSITEEHKKKYVNIYIEMERLQDLSDTQWKQIIDLAKESTDIANENFDKYFDSQMLSLRNREQELQEKIASLEESTKDELNTDKNLQNQLEISSLKVELAGLKVDISKKEYDLYQEYFNNISKFQEPELISLIDNLYISYEETQSELNKARNSYYDLRGEVYQTWLDIRDARVQRLSYFDFLYFSFTISIASPFGDILPNNRNIRIMVFVQLFIDIFLISLFVSRFTESFNAKRVENIRPLNHQKDRRKRNYSSPKKRLRIFNKR